MTPSRTVRVRVLQGFCLERARDVHPGDQVELDERRARQKAHAGYVELLPQETAPSETHGTDSVRTTPVKGGAASKEGKKS